MSNKASRTERPTAKKLDDARKKGRVPRTQEVSAALVMGTFLGFFELYGGVWLDEMRRLTVQVLSPAAFSMDLQPQQLMLLTGTIGMAMLQLLFLPVALMGAASMAGNLLQGPPPWSTHPLKPDFTKLNPFTGIKKVVRLKAWVDLGKASLKMVLFTAVTWFALRQAIADGLEGARTAEGTLHAIAALTGTVLLRVVFLMLALALVDLLYTRWDHVRNLRMTKEEVKEERKQMEGDPLIRAKMRQRQMEMSRRRMMAEVPHASVVVTNPEHFAVALRYVHGEDAVPRVVAKGADRIAFRIREIAREHGVPVHRDPPLARALYKAVEVGDAIPQALFRAVAEVLALVLRGRRRRAPRRAARPAPEGTAS